MKLPTEEKNILETGRTTAPSPTSGQRSKRERKAVERLTIDRQDSSRKHIESMGQGATLRSIPNVRYKLSKISGRSEVVEALHLLMYRRKGTSQNRKKNVLDFNGLSYQDEEIAEREINSRMISMGKMKLDLIHAMLDALDIKRGSGDKQTKMNLLISFLKEPKQLSDVDLEQKDAAKKEGAKRKRGSQGQQKKQSEPRQTKNSEDAKKETTIQRFMEDEDDQEPADKIPLGWVRTEIYNMLEAMTNEEFTTVTTKMIMAKLSVKFQCDMRPRKLEVKEIAKAYAQDRLSI